MATVAKVEGALDLDDLELIESLDCNRWVVERKVADLGLADATRIVLPSGVTLLGVMRHLAWVERAWFPHHLLGAPFETVTIDESFHVHTVVSVRQALAMRTAGLRDTDGNDVRCITHERFPSR